MGELDNKKPTNDKNEPPKKDTVHTGSDQTTTPPEKKAAGAPDAHADLQTPAGPAAHADQQKVLEQTSPARANATMVEAGHLPDTKVVGGQGDRAPDKIVVSDKPLTPEQKYFTDLYQHRFTDLKVLSKITPMPEPNEGEKQEDLAKRYQTLLEDRAKEIKKEMGQQDPSGQTWMVPPKFGTATQQAYKDYIDWIQKKEVPGQILALQSGGLPFPTGNPIEVPIENGRRISLDDYDNRLATGKLQANLHVDGGQPPTLENAQKLENALDWSNQARDSLAEANLKRFDDKMQETIKTMGFPDGWQYQPGQDKNAWRISVAQMIDLTTSVGRMANLVDKMHLPIELPPGAKVTTGATSSNISLDLPKDLRLNDPETAEKVRQLQEWEKKAKPQLDSVRERLSEVAKNPNLAIAWGDTTIPKVRDAKGNEVSAMASFDKEGRTIAIVDPTNLKLDKDGKLLGTVDPNKPTPPGEKFQEANLLEQRFTATTDQKTGEIVVKQNVQAQEAPWWSYENAIYTNIGKPADLPERRFKPDDLVAVNKGSGTEFMLAKDLENYQKTAAFVHYGENILMGAMDAAMLATGTIEIGAAVKGARLLYAAAEAGAAVTRQDVVKAGARGLWDLSLGATGVSNSAEMQSSSWGRTFANTRNAAFLGTIFYGAAAAKIPALRLFDRGGQAAEDVAAAERGAPGTQPARAAEAGATEKAVATDDIYTARGTDGRVFGTSSTTTPLQRAFDYTTGADGKASLSKITVGSGDTQVTLTRGANSDHDWVVHTDKGDMKLQADIRVDSDGSYTVSHISDERADWYQKAFYSEKPPTPIVREVTYHPDGSITTKGFESQYKPPEGSTYRKEARFGEYWTEPDGKQVWVDGEANIWRERSKGIWQSDRGVLAENMEYVKKERTKAEELKAPLDWPRIEKIKDKVTGQEVEVEKIIHAKPGDMKIMEPDGKKFYTVERDVFDRTYDPAPGVDGEYMKKPVRARVLTEEFEGVETRWGKQHGDIGDYLVTGLDGETYPVKKATFEKLYQRTTADTDPATFSLPKPTGAAVQHEDGTIVVPHEHGEVIWSAKSDSVTITDSRTGQSNTFSQIDLHSAGTRFYFAAGAEERITPSGLRFYRTPDMPAGEFRGEDGAVLRDAPRAEPHPVDDRDPSPTKYSDAPSQLPGARDLDVSKFVRVGDGGASAAHDKVPDPSVKAYGYIDGDRYMIDSRNRLWQEFGPTTWTNEHGTLRINQQGKYWHWNDGTSDWVDTEGRSWHREGSDPPGHWKSPDGATYDEGTWQYTPRTKNDPHVPAIVEALRKAGLSEGALYIAAQVRPINPSLPDAGTAQNGQTPGNPVDAAGNTKPETAQDAMKGPAAKSVEELAQKLMLYSTYPMVAQQLGDILKQGKDIIGMQLQSMGYQLNQMWAPNNPYALAHALQDYDSMQPAKRPDLDAKDKPKFDPTCDTCPGVDPVKVAQEYKEAFTQNLPDTFGSKVTRKEITELFDRLAHSVSIAGTLTERDNLKKELVEAASFDRFDIEQLDQANHGPLSNEQLRDLLDPDKRAALSNTMLRDAANQVFEMKDPNLLAATNMALLMLSKSSTGQPGTVGADIESYGHFAGANERGERFVRERTVRIDMDPALIGKNLQRSLASMNSDGRGLAVGDLLVKSDMLAPQQYGSVLQNILNNPKASATDKMHALSDANGPRMAALVAGMIAQQSINGGNNKGGAVATAGDFGANVEDFKSTLAQVAVTDKDANVRAMSAALLYGLKRFQDDSRKGATVLDAVALMRQQDIDTKQGDFAADALKLITKQVAAGQDNYTQRRIDAAETLMLMKATAPAGAASEIQKQISVALADSLRGARPEQKNRIADMLVGDGMKVLQEANPNLADNARTQLIASLKLPEHYDAADENRLVSLVGKMSGITDGAGSATKGELYTALANIAQNAPPVYLNLRSAAIDALGSMGAQAAIPALESMATSEKFPALRLSALKALEQIKDPQLSSLVAKRLGTGTGTEGDATVVSYLRDMQYRLGGDRATSSQYGDAAAALMKFQSSIDERYASMRSFGANAQKTWINGQFPLLVRENFDKQLIADSRGKTTWWSGLPSDDPGNAVTAKRQEQFNQLAELAQGNSDQAMQARRVLYSMITGSGGTIGAAERIPTNLYVPRTPMGAGMPQQWYYDEQKKDWAAAAAMALAKTANAGYAGRDWSARLISMALASGVQGEARNELLKAWDLLGTSSGGVRAIPESLYQYVRKLGSDK